MLADSDRSSRSVDIAPRRTKAVPADIAWQLLADPGRVELRRAGYRLLRLRGRDTVQLRKILGRCAELKASGQDRTAVVASGSDSPLATRAGPDSTHRSGMS